MHVPTALVSNRDKTMDASEEQGKNALLIAVLIVVMINPTEHTIPVGSTAAPTTEMHIDEESRPRFPPSAQTVLSSGIIADIRHLPSRRQGK